MSDTVLVLNSGSSSLKYQLVEPRTGTSLVDGIVERIGEDGGVADHEAALRAAFEVIAPGGQELSALGLVAVGHRVVHGGPNLYRPTIVDDRLVAELRELAPLAPLHNPPAVLGIEVARRVLPDLPHIAVFDTAFFHDLPPLRPPTPSTARSRPAGISAAMASTAPPMTTSALRPLSSWAPQGNR